MGSCRERKAWTVPQLAASAVDEDLSLATGVRVDCDWLPGPRYILLDCGDLALAITQEKSRDPRGLHEEFLSFQGEQVARRKRGAVSLCVVRTFSQCPDRSSSARKGNTKLHPPSGVEHDQSS